ncbi:family 20 glycosylhydrolase [PVC group bacterium]|nr:family 20 glycosylhydrolase [PVC group bacterium]
MNGFMLDSARCLENRDYYRKVISFAADRGMNTILWHFTDDQGCMMKFDSHPEIASPHAYSKQEMKSLIRFAKKQGVTLIPELETLGHSRYITEHKKYRHLREGKGNWQTSLCPVHPETRKIMSELIAEVVEIFDSPWIHAGLDEVGYGYHQRTKTALKKQTKAELFADYINFIHKEITANDRKMMMWGDHLLADNAIAPLISKDILICDWHYDPPVASRSVKYLLSQGFNLLLCPGLIWHQEKLFAGRDAIAGVRSFSRHRSMKGRGHIKGMITTVWTPTRYMHDSLWMPMSLSAEIMKRGSKVSFDASAKRFADSFYEFNAPFVWVEACRYVSDNIPARTEQLALLGFANGLKGWRLNTRRVKEWDKVAETLTFFRTSIKKNRRAYDTYLLMVRLVALLYDRADAIERKRIGKTVNEKRIHKILQKQETILSAIEETWDRERYADDPKKIKPTFPFDEENHLIPLLRDAFARTSVIQLSCSK